MTSIGIGDIMVSSVRVAATVQTSDMPLSNKSVNFSLVEE
jgi:hypothetical protein